MRPGRVAALRVLIDALRGDGPYGLAQRLAALPRLVVGAARGAYGGWDRRRVLGVVLGLAYVVSPVDVVPELFLGVFGLADDALVAAWLAGAVLSEVDHFLDWERARDRVVRGTVA
ncbi:YkvA family protein [Jannaschia sp. R86511]|uniref:YkvA family protein n=1 Tax=Jannaschia sp. R86511 TaxID=3093853 RepID=UPI0036D2C5A1